MLFAVVPTATAPILIGAVGEREKPPATEFPDSSINKLPLALFPRLAKTSKSSLLLPGVAGAVNVKLKTQVLPELPEGKTSPTAQVDDGKVVKFETLVPNVGSEVIVRGPFPRFATVADWALLVVPSN